MGGEGKDSGSPLSVSCFLLGPDCHLHSVTGVGMGPQEELSCDNAGRKGASICLQLQAQCVSLEFLEKPKVLCKCNRASN